MDCLDINCPCPLPEHRPDNSKEVAYHSEIIVDGELHIPEIKPPAEKIINITKKICLTKVVKVPVKLDNGCLAGCKVLVVGTVRLGFEYSANVPEQNVHFVHFDVPFQGLITGNNCHKPIPLCDCNLRKFDLNVYVEHIDAELVGPRTIEKVVVLLLWLKRKGHEHHDHCETKYEHHKHCEPEHEFHNPCEPEHDCFNPCENGHEYPIVCEPGHEYPNHYGMAYANPNACDTDYEYTGGEPLHECSKPPHCKPECEVSKQISINHTLCIPPQKPPAECLLSSSVDIEIHKAEVIDTPLTTHVHCPIMKVVVTGKAEITVKYVADVPNQQVHAAVFRIPFEALIEWPEGPPKHTPVCVTVTIEHFHIDKLDPRRLFMVMVLKLDVTQK